MGYAKVEWHHDVQNEPKLILSEIEDGWEGRKAQVYRSGRSQRARRGYETGVCPEFS